MASKLQPYGKPLQGIEEVKNPHSRHEMKACGERKIRKFTECNVVRPQVKHLVAHSVNMTGGFIGKARHMNKKIQYHDASELEIQGIEPVENIKPLIAASRLKQFDYPPKYINRSNVLQHKNNIYGVQSHKMKQVRGKSKSRHAELPIKKQIIQPLCNDMKSLHLNEKITKANSTQEKSFLTEYCISQKAGIVTKDNAADEATQGSNLTNTAITIVRDEVDAVSNRMHTCSWSDINVNYTWNSQYVDSQQFTRDKASYNVMDSRTLFVSHEPANVGKTLLMSGISSESQENWSTNKHSNVSDVQPYGSETTQNNNITHDGRSSATSSVVISETDKVQRIVCHSPFTENESLSANSNMETSTWNSGSQYSTASRLAHIIKPYHDHESRNEHIVEGSKCATVSTNAYVRGICDETSEKSITTKRLGKPFTCEKYKKSFSCLSTQAIHERIHSGETAYKCDICGKCFSKKSHLTRHKRVHTGEQPYECDTCGKCFSEASVLKRHTRIHTGEKPYKCDTCGKCFSQKCNLTSHIRIHTGEHPYKCDTCGKCFTLATNLKMHTLIHTGEKPYECDMCGKCFSHKYHLTSHVRIHTGEKPYKCHTCGKSFTQPGNLKKHTRIHTGEKPYECDTCGKCFNQTSGLKKHTRIHTDEKPFKCDTFGKFFTQASYLKKHTLIHTGEKEFPIARGSSI